jgi:hypothetical protein
MASCIRRVLFDTTPLFPRSTSQRQLSLVFLLYKAQEAVPFPAAVSPYSHPNVSWPMFPWVTEGNLLPAFQSNFLRIPAHLILYGNRGMHNSLQSREHIQNPKLSPCFRCLILDSVPFSHRRTTQPVCRGIPPILSICCECYYELS